MAKILYLESTPPPMTTSILLLLLIVPLIWAVRRLAIAKLLLGYEFRPSQVTPLGRDAVSQPMLEASRPWVKQLEALGFKWVGGLHIARVGNPAFDREAVVLIHPEQSVRAMIWPHNEADHAGECWITFRSTTAAGHELITSSCLPEELSPRPAALRFQFGVNVTLPEILQKHGIRVMNEGTPMWPCGSIEAAAAREQMICDAEFRHLRASGLFTEENGFLSYRVWPALARAHEMVRIASVQKKHRAAAVPVVIGATKISEESLLALNLRDYQQYVALSTGRMSGPAKALLAVGSLLAFSLLFGWGESPVVAVTVVLALLIHEGGHLAGMRLFGHRDTQMLFIPFLGAAAIAHDEKVLKPWQHIVILLLGPLPGIFLGLGLLAYQAATGGPAWLHTVALIMIGLNAFNLLPVLPLDGGHIVDYAVASRVPRVRVLFLAVSAAVMLLIGLSASGLGLLIGLGAAGLIRVPLEWRMAGLRREMRDEQPDDADTLVRRLLQHMRDPIWAKTKAVGRFQVVRELQRVLRTPKPGFGTICFAFAGFTAPLWIGMPLAVWSATFRSDRLLREADARAAEAGLVYVAAATTQSAVAASDNAAVPFAKAVVLQKPGERVSGEVLGLLRSAAQKRIFVPNVTEGISGTFGASPHGDLIHSLIAVSAERLRYGDNQEALAMAIDGLRLIRLMDSAPGWWLWDDHERFSQSAWTALEDSLATGIPVQRAQVAMIRELADERAEIAFAVASLPQSLLRHAHAPTAPGSGRFLRAVHAAQNLAPELARMRADTVDRAVMVRDHLRRIERGDWPELPAGSDRNAETMAFIARLGDLVARQREARLALTWIEQRQKSGATALQIGQALADATHPLTRERVRVVQKGSIQVLAFERGISRIFGAFEGVEIEWRLPQLAAAKH